MQVFHVGQPLTSVRGSVFMHWQIIMTTEPQMPARLLGLGLHGLINLANQYDTLVYKFLRIYQNPQLAIFTRNEIARLKKSNPEIFTDIIIPPAIRTFLLSYYCINTFATLAPLVVHTSANISHFLSSPSHRRAVINKITTKKAFYFSSKVSFAMLVFANIYQNTDSVMTALSAAFIAFCSLSVSDMVESYNHPVRFDLLTDLFDTPEDKDVAAQVDENAPRRIFFGYK